ncbi:NifB/NifX family molybdenum-iron cluster-binding protein [Natranaerobius thermophilus]|uniref:Dinitrogenase iron-molybdenum cofactor biosynthesis protein n=1 Tax=Natranaerobius thermophilus (strain ATCC BAA-1301 / DSM 18059 / JW/NM-WN-LF) TaxID=457570 RepID=B2A0V6_NATTJ|nr:NifB/NifX family molybdenum-iron cluster-binding protein [Natranaerobius thermophilus]ACB85986.1 Dinitrogenase iron-molybdenum cofactor biosynthesis protein [Natranaerobius thermophilus JW/NM-WN-LF]
MIAITAKGENAESPMDAYLDQRFGRCEYFVLYRQNDDEVEILPNRARNSDSGAGVRAAQLIADQGVKVIITGKVGPKAMRALQASNVDVYTEATGTVRTALEEYQQGQLKMEKYQ